MVSIDPLDDAAYDVATRAAGPAGKLPFTEDQLRDSPSGDLFVVAWDSYDQDGDGYGRFQQRFTKSLFTELFDHRV